MLDDLDHLVEPARGPRSQSRRLVLLADDV
jgi:hypothetical protein